MTRKFSLLTLFIALILVIQLLSCGSDVDPNTLVAVDRTTGMLYSVNSGNGAKKEIGTITLNSTPVSNIRSMVFDDRTEMIYAASTSSGGGAVYKIDPKTLEATVINSDAGDNWYGIASLLMTQDKKLLAILWHKNPVDVGMTTFSLSGAKGARLDFSLSICCGMGTIYGDSKSEIILIGNELQIYECQLDGSCLTESSLTFEGFDENAVVEVLFVQNMVRVNSQVFAIVYDSNLGNTYLAKVNLKSQVLTQVGLLNVDSDNRYHGLMYVPKEIF